ENDIIDLEVFGQILDMDEEDDNEFSRSIVYNYFDQAKTTFKEMDDALKTEDLPELSRKGHFLKGSSAALGLKNLKNICEKIQHLGSNKDELGITDISQEEALSRIKSSLKAVKEEYERAESYLRELYEED
ncbi:HPT domain-containing protein, partial [Conidiobolus coronatus NRRL 28638]